MNVLLMLFAGVMNVANSVPAGAAALIVIVVCVPVLGISNNTSVGAGGVVVVLPSKNNTNPADIPEVP
jgi:hypothetical protein